MNRIKEIDSRSLAALLEQDAQAVRLIDVRSPGEMAQGMLPTGEPMPLHLVPLKADELIHSDRPVVLYCRSGARSAQAAVFLVSRGADPERVINLRGGIIDWVKQGNQLLAPDSAAMSA